MYLAEALAKLDHDVTVINTSFVTRHLPKYNTILYKIHYLKHIIPETYNNVKYINYDKFESTNCDYIITTYNTDDLEILKKINNYKKMIVIMNNPLCGSNMYKFQSLDKTKILIAFISNYSKDNILLNNDKFLKEYQHILLHNSIDNNDIKLITKKENSFIFFACIERGFEMSNEIIKKFDNTSKFKIYTNTYADIPKSLLNINNNIITPDTSKNTIFEYCAKSKYFLYPLIDLETNNIHCDTFAYVVLEALLSGVVVIAPKMKLFEELYGNAICYIDTCNIISNKYLESEYVNGVRCNKHPEFGYPVINKYVEKLNLLEQNNELYNSYVEKGLLLKEKYSHVNIVNTLLDNIDKLKDVHIDINNTDIIIINKLLHYRLNKYK
jgi:glycosyltransferase involved in cell wall biosynthesis